MAETTPVQCPHCGTMMDDRARFCPGCGTPRSAVREQLERESIATGVPYAELLDRERGATAGSRPPTHVGGWSTPEPPPAPPRKERGRLWLVLGIIGGMLLLACVGCVVTAAVLIDRFDVDIGDSPEGSAAREQLQLATQGRHEERWDLLHPDHQIAVPIDLFVTCAEFEGDGSIDILASFGNDGSFIRRIGIVDSRVVIYTIEGRGTTNTDFVEMVQLDGEWRWTLEDSDLNQYEAGRCP